MLSAIQVVFYFFNFLDKTTSWVAVRSHQEVHNMWLLLLFFFFL